MFSPDQYQLLDFGEGRKLERFGAYVLDRPAPAAEGASKSDRSLWSSAQARYERSEGQRGEWVGCGALPPRWVIGHPAGQGMLRLELKLTEFGHLGVFPEQADNWDWIAHQVRQSGRPLKVLNLFAYTGGSTLAAAAAGAEVVHVDAAKNIVAWARRNAEQSGLSTARIRWLSEDAQKFVQREVRRGNRYHAVILDPPSYGHGPKGQVWKLEQHLPPLLAACGQLTGGRPVFWLLTCHSPRLGPSELKAMLADTVLGQQARAATARPLVIPAADGRRLTSGVAVKYSASKQTSQQA